MATEKENIIQNSVTDIDRRKAYINLEFLMACQGLPNTMSKVAGIVLCLICHRIRYGYGQVQPGYSYISNINPITIDTILQNAVPIALSEGKDVENYRKNYRKHIASLHSNNIFYVWKCGKYYIFIMERDIRSWIVYNKEGSVTPNSLIKIINRSRFIMNDMARFHCSSGSYMKVSDIESEFGFFINGVINKMNPLIASEELPVWDKDKHIYEYLSCLSEKLIGLEKFDGLNQSSDYMSRLPAYTRDNVIKMSGDIDMNIKLEKDIVPVGDKANLNKKPRKKRKKKSDESIVVDGEPVKPQRERFNMKSIDPFQDGQSLSCYYKALIEQISGRGHIKFEEPAVDNRVGVEILDLLKENNLKDKEFLNDWIKYFYENSLKGDKVLKIDYNSLSAFRWTFERFKDTYHVPQ